MGRRYRERRALTAAVATHHAYTDYVENHEMVDDSSQQMLEHLQTGTGVGIPPDYPPQFPVQLEMYHPMAASYAVTPTPVQSVKDNLDYNEGGQRGMVDVLPYSLGVVSSDSVENFDLDGRQAIIRRGRNPSETGPVGGSDYSAFLSMAYAQSVNQYYPNEESQYDLIKAI